jgi:O-antigen/teichoic acid export membrane protein
LWPQLLSFLFTLGLPAALVVKAKEQPERASGLVGAALALSVAMGFVAAGAGYVALPRLLTQYDAGVVAFARDLLVFVVLGVTSTVLVAGLQLRERFVVFNRVRWWQSVLVLAALLALVAVDRFSPQNAALAYALPTVPFLVWNASWVARELRPRLAAFAANTRTLLAYGVRAHGIDAIGTLLMQLDKLILIGILAPAVFGVYVVMYNLSRLITTFATSVVPVLLPRTAGKPIEEVLELTQRSLGAVTVLSAAAVGCFALLGWPLLRVLYGPDFTAGYVTLLLLAAEAAFASAASVLQQPYMVTNRVGTVVVFQAISLCVAAALIYAFAQRFGVEGAAAGLLVASSLRAVLTYAGYRHRFGVSAPRLLPQRQEWLLVFAKLRGHHR